MLLEIIDVPSNRDEPVCFRTEFGEGKARWQSGSISPDVGEAYGVEIDVDEIAELGRNTERITLVAPSLAVEGDFLVFCGTLEQIDTDGMGYMRMADDCLFMIETAGGFSPGDGVRVTVPIASVRVTPIGS